MHAIPPVTRHDIDKEIKVVRQRETTAGGWGLCTVKYAQEKKGILKFYSDTWLEMPIGRGKLLKQFWA